MSALSGSVGGLREVEVPLPFEVDPKHWAAYVEEREAYRQAGSGFAA